MFKLGSRRRSYSGHGVRHSSGGAVSAKANPQFKMGEDGLPVRMPGNRVKLKSNFGGGAGGCSGGSSGGFGGGSGPKGRVDTMNNIIDDLSRGTVVEDWIPTDPVLQNRMFRHMFVRGGIEGNIVETINDLVWSDFEFVGIKDREILDTFMAAKEASGLAEVMPHMTTEHLVIGRACAQLVLDPTDGIWRDIIVFNSDYLSIQGMPRHGYMPLIDMLPDPQIQQWLKSTDERMVESRKGIPKSMLDLLASNRAVPLDPETTVYLPRRQFFHDAYGTSFFVRNILMWGLEKSLINATMSGHRRRSGPITQIAVGSDTREASIDEISSYVDTFLACEEDSVNSVFGTHHDVVVNQVRGSLAEMWKWQDEYSFIQEYKMKMYGFSDSWLTGDANVDTSTSPTIFLERLKAHRAYMTREMILNKFCRTLAKVHQFTVKTEAELSHRIRVNRENEELIIPSVRFKKNLDNTADSARADLLQTMVDKGLPVSQSEWNSALGGGDLMERYRNAAEDLELRLSSMMLQKLRAETSVIQDELADMDSKEMTSKVDSIRERLKGINFADDDKAWDVARLSRENRKVAMDVADGEMSGSVVGPTNKTVFGSNQHDAMLDRSVNDPRTYSKVGQVA